MLCLLGNAIVSGIAGAQDRTREVDQHFIDERASQEALFKTLPGTHITPINNRMIFTLMLNALDAKIDGSGKNNPADHEQLRVRNYSLEPYIALSGKHFGGGLSAEIGEARTKYDAPTNDLHEQSVLRYQGAGVHMFYTPMEKSSRARLTFVAGTKVLGAKHKAKSSLAHNQLEANKWEEQRYQVSRSRIGANLDIRVLESFSLIPWVDHNYTYSKDLSNRIGHENKDKQVQLAERFSGDNEIYWQPGSQWLYGLDAAARIKNFEIHFGNLLGTLLAPNAGSNRIVNHSYSVSVIFLTPTE
jgi:hypothetical protein